MKRLILLGMLMIGVVLLLQSAASAGSEHATINQWYTVMESCEISKDGGITWFTVFEGRTSQFNMVNQPDVPTGDKTVPAGTYNKYRVHGTYNKFVITYSQGDNSSTLYDQEGNAYIEDNDEYTVTGDMTCVVNADGTTNAYIDFNPDTAITTCEATWDDPKWTMTAFQFDPEVTVHE